MAVVMMAFDGGVLDGAFHPLDLAIGPRMVGFGEAVLDPVLAAYLIEPMDAHARGLAITVLWKVGELDAIVGQDGM